jgi:hypothetical protein
VEKYLLVITNEIDDAYETGNCASNFGDNLGESKKEKKRRELTTKYCGRTQDFKMGRETCSFSKCCTSGVPISCDRRSFFAMFHVIIADNRDYVKRGS